MTRSDAGCPNWPNRGSCAAWHPSSTTGGSGTAWRTDPSTGLTGILLTQRMVTSPEPTELAKDFWAAAYASIDA